MAKEKNGATEPKADAPSLPSLGDIESVEPAALPEGRTGLTTDEIAIAEAIIAASSDGKHARGPKLADKRTAQIAAARIKRLVVNYWRQRGIPEMERVALGTRTVPRDDGYAWIISQKPMTAAETPDADGDAESSETAPATA